MNNSRLRFLCSKWGEFDDAELRVLFDALTMDDGIRYGVERDDEPTRGLVEELLAVAQERGDLDLPGDVLSNV